LYDALSRRACRSLRVARAFTGYQHHELVRSLPGRVRPNASLVVAPAVAAPYAAEVRAAADRRLDATATAAGLRVEGAGFRTDVPGPAGAPGGARRAAVVVRGYHAGRRRLRSDAARGTCDCTSDTEGSHARHSHVGRD